MPRKPFGPAAHCGIDYALVAYQALGPTLFGLTGPARAIAYGFAATTGVVNALTDQPYAVKREVPFRVHGVLDYLFVPGLVALPWLAGALVKRNERAYFLPFVAAAGLHVLLTDYGARPNRG